MSGGISAEPDYVSRTAGLGISVDTLDKNLTPTLIVTYGWDDAGRTGLARTTGLVPASVAQWPSR